MPDIAAGTASYSPQVARRLRAANMAAWIGIALSVVFALRYLLESRPGLTSAAIVNIADALLLMAVPLLHRWSTVAGGNLVLAVGLHAVTMLSLQLGTDSGLYLYGLAAPALAILFFGTDRPLFSVVWAIVSVSMIVALRQFGPSSTGVLSPDALFWGNFVPTTAACVALMFAIVFYAVRQGSRAEAAAEREQARSDELLLQILPAEVAARLKDRIVVADRYEEASILFADMAGFTARAGDMTPEALVQFLNRVFGAFDALVERHKLEKIKTTGDSYMVVAGVPKPRGDHAEAMADFALAMAKEASRLLDDHGRPVPLRIGIACGPVVAGVVGTRKFFYDVWGDAVNMASRMESTGVPGRIQVNADIHNRLVGLFELEERGLVDVRGKGTMPTWFLTGRIHPASAAVRA